MLNRVKTTRRPPRRAQAARRVPRRGLAGVELATGAAALSGGLLLAAGPDGSLLHADPQVLAGAPFADWRVPGLLLTTLVGGGYLIAGCWQWRGSRGARTAS